MSRFRFMGRHPDTRLWVSGNGIEIVPACNGWDEDRAYILNRGCRTEVEKDSVCQSTGYFDSHNDEIFDGCILSKEGAWDGIKLFRVERQEDGSCVLVDKQDDSKHCLGDFLGDYRIIAHQYEAAEAAKLLNK